MPVHTGFENQVASSPSSHQRAEILRAGVIDAASLQVAPLRIEHAIDAVCLVIIDTDERRHPYWLNWCLFMQTTYTIELMRPAEPPSRRSSNHQAFMSPHCCRGGGIEHRTMEARQQRCELRKQRDSCLVQTKRLHTT